ncbi:MAG: DUF47 domain-containing protein [Steroidobacteraceae bacterium]|jgi:uncharacterized protein Yka (UPF0111/DUF47 family)
MATKTSIIGELGEAALLLPQHLQRALAANDRLKFCFTLLQAAENHASHPEDPPLDLKAERIAANLPAGELDAAVALSRREADGALHLGGAARLQQEMLEDIASMSAPLALAGSGEAETFSARARTLLAALPPFTDDRVPAGLVGAMTSANRGAGDSLHILVMDLHKAINALQAALAEESIDGARVWRIDAADRPLIRAFMSGLNETARLKFDHPGLATIATRSGARLVIENDIGTTDAHVLVLHVEGLSAILTYTDVHARRLKFFQKLFEPFGVHWDDTLARSSERLGEEPNYYLSIGRYDAADAKMLERYLAFLGSRIVFLIDWNHARKRLREFLGKGDGVRLLKWAADNNIGHRGFLKLGGERLLYEAIEFAQRTPLHVGERLHEALGPEAAFEYLQFVFRESTTGLLQARSERFIRDAIKAELARRFHTAQASLLAIGLTHAERVFDLATSVHDGLLRCADPGAAEFLGRTARRASVWEHECDVLVTRIRSLARRTATPEVYAALMHAVDDAADGLEEAAFLMTHLSAAPVSDELIETARRLASLVQSAAQESVKMFEAASHVTPEGAREDMQDFFAAADRIVGLEHETDAAERAVTRALLASGADVKSFYLLSRIGNALEGAADGLAHGAFKLRDHLLDDVLTG